MEATQTIIDENTDVLTLDELTTFEQFGAVVSRLNNAKEDLKECNKQIKAIKLSNPVFQKATRLRGEIKTAKALLGLK